MHWLVGLLAVTKYRAVLAQTPPFKGALTLEPGLTVGKCMTASSNQDGGLVQLQPCTYSDNQLWTFTSGTLRTFGNKCLDVTDGNPVDGTNLQIWTCSANNANQQFYYTSDNRLAWTNRGKCVDLTAGNTASGTQIKSYTCTDNNENQIWNTGFNVKNLPVTSQNGQYGTNNCGTTSSQTSKCQTVYINSAEDFCLWGPPSAGSTVGDTEEDQVAWCTKSGRGTRTIPNGSLKGVHFVKTPDYVQVTGVGDFTNLNIRKGDEGGELDNRGADGRGNPIGGLVFGDTFGNGTQYHEWTNFMSDTEFCFRACIGADATKHCNHIYDVMGCTWNMPANYEPGVFENCDADDDLPMGVYGTSTWYQGVTPTPSAHPAAASSNCHPIPTVSIAPAKREFHIRGRHGIHAPAFPSATVF